MFKNSKTRRNCAMTLTRNIFSLVLCIVLILGLVQPVSAAVPGDVDVLSGAYYNNISRQDYLTVAKPMYSYLTETDDQYMMAQVYNDNQINKMTVSYFDHDFHINSQKNITFDLPVWGGFYASNMYYFTVTGKPSESYEEVDFRVTKYSKSWVELDSVDIACEKTISPFSSGSCRMAMYNNYLVIHTCQYATIGDNYHQTNKTLIVETDSMTCVYKERYNDAPFAGDEPSYAYCGYVSHSFNQFVQVDGENIVTLDHGDCYPRSAVLCKLGWTGGGMAKQNPERLVFDYADAVQMLKFRGEYGLNDTGASLGGFEISDTSYIVAGSSIDQNSASSSTRNVFVSVVDRKMSKTPAVTYLTDYAEGEASATTPQLVKISNDKFMILWQHEEKVFWTLLDGEGNKKGSIQSCVGVLSDCKPIVSRGSVIWYVRDGAKLDFYSIPVSDPKSCSIKRTDGGHQYYLSGMNGNTGEATCKICGHKENATLLSNFVVSWKFKDDQGYSNADKVPDCESLKAGDYIDLYYGIDKASVLWDDIEVEISDPNILEYNEIQYSQYPDGRLTVKGTGEVDVTFCPRFNRSLAKTFHLYIGMKVPVIEPDTVKVKSITISGNKTEIYPGWGFYLTADVQPSNATRRGVTWSSSDSNIVKVEAEADRALVCGVNPGTAIITAEAMDGSGVKGTYTIRVLEDNDEDEEEEQDVNTKKEVKLKRITISLKPTKLVYYVGEVFDPSGMEVTAIYSNNKKAIVNGYTITPSGELSMDNHTIQISYTEGGITKTASLAITVKFKERILERIAVSRAPRKTKYTEGEKFSTSNMKIMAYYDNGQKRIVKTYSYSPEGPLSVNDKKIIISYTENGITKTVEQAITVSAKNAENEQNDSVNENNAEKSKKYDFSVGGIRYAFNSGSKKTTVTVTGAAKKKAKVTIPAIVKYKGKKYKVTAIGKEAFMNDKKLKTLVIGENVQVIKDDAFSHCNKLKKISIKNCSLKKVSEEAFSGDGINGMVEITVTVKNSKNTDSVIDILREAGFFSVRIKCSIAA